ncbi:hypothetical protein ACIBEA_21495 [Streptomyces sp. NPDC051555]|uniref:hypothetical protein n=1 Tax=Streptomyces sp. NPDC051555 TaxID=3365657 RepID=UPI0037BD7684
MNETLSITVKIDKHQISSIVGDPAIPEQKRSYDRVKFVNDKGISGQHVIIGEPEPPADFTFQYMDNPNDKTDKKNSQALATWFAEPPSSDKRVNFSVVKYEFGEMKTYDVKGAKLIAHTEPSGKNPGSATVVAEEWIPGK